MPVRVLLDRPHAHFTNLDFVTGRVLLSLASDETVSSIVVKLEGESNTRLIGSRPDFKAEPNEAPKKKTELEVHKVS